MIQLTLTNTLRIDNLPEDILVQLMEKLTIENPKYLESEKMGRYTGKMPRYLEFYRQTGEAGLIVPRGYIRQCMLYFKRLGLPYQLCDQRCTLPEVSYGFSGELKPFQKQAVNKMLEKEFGTLRSPTGSGKTVMALYMIAKRQQPALVVVHLKDLAYQWMNRIETFLNIPANEIGLIGDGKYSIGEKITLALVQTLYKKVDEVAPKIGYLVVDECHRAPSRTFTHAVTGFSSRYMLGLSATPYRRDRLSKLIFWHLGDVHHEIEKEGLVETGDVLDCEVIIRNTQFVPYVDPVREYTKMLSELTMDTDRNLLIAGDVAKEASLGKGACLVLSDRKKHCHNLYSLLKYRHGLNPGLLTGDVPQARRNEVIEKLNTGEINILVATGPLVGEGFDCKALSTLFITTPIRFSGRLLQYLGRVLRSAPGKEKARVYDYRDEFVDVLVHSAKERMRIYTQER